MAVHGKNMRIETFMWIPDPSPRHKNDIIHAVEAQKPNPFEIIAQLCKAAARGNVEAALQLKILENQQLSVLRVLEAQHELRVIQDVAATIASYSH